MFLIELELSKMLGPLLAKIFAPPNGFALVFAASSVPLFAVNKLVDLTSEKTPIPWKILSFLNKLAKGFETYFGFSCSGLDSAGLPFYPLGVIYCD